jgi:hypothetical protein
MIIKILEMSGAWYYPVVVLSDEILKLCSVPSQIKMP